MDRPLALCHYTMIDVPPPELVEIAARAGFTHVSLMVQFPRQLAMDYQLAGDTRTRRETKRRLDDAGVRAVDASTCRLEPDTDVEQYRPAIETAAFLGAGQVNVNGDDPDRVRMAERFSRLCAMADEYGLRVGIENMMITEVKTVGDAVRLIADSGANNAVITVDAVHLARSGGSPADIAALDPALIGYLQLCDGPAVMPPESFLWEAGTERLLPGDGELPLRELAAAVPTGTVIGVEAPSQRRRDAGVTHQEYAGQVMRSLHRVLDLTDSPVE